MRTFKHLAIGFIFPVLFFIPFSSCDYFDFEQGQGQLSLSFLRSSFIATRTVVDLPDTNDFILTIDNSKGDHIYQGPYGKAPEIVTLDEGTYSVSVLSCDFTTPKFSSPQYGDRQQVVVKKGSFTSIQLICRQLNSGVILKIGSDFLTSFPDASLLLKSAEGKLVYGYKEKRIAYFNPGNVSLVMSQGANDKILFSRMMESQEILTLNVSAPDKSASSSDNISITIDTSHIWKYEDVIIGGGQDENGKDKTNALSIAQAKNNIGAEDVWVYGYIVGGDLSSSSASFNSPFSSRTNIVIASKSSVTNKSSCLSVRLEKGDVRDELNLVDNPDNLGCEVFLKGNIISSYYGIPGIEKITEFDFK